MQRGKRRSIQSKTCPDIAQSKWTISAAIRTKSGQTHTHGQMVAGPQSKMVQHTSSAKGESPMRAASTAAITLALGSLAATGSAMSGGGGGGASAAGSMPS